MLFSSPDYPVFLIAVFFLYALARWGGPRHAWARVAVMVLLGDVVFMLVSKDVDTLWDPIGGVLLRLVATGDHDWPLWLFAHWLIGATVLAAAVVTGKSRAAWIASDRGQRLIAYGFVAVIAAVGATVWIASRAHALDAVTEELVAHGHLVVLFVLGIGLGASTAGDRPLGRVVVLFVASSLFYHAWASAMPGPYRYLLALLLATIVLDYYLAIWIERAEVHWKRKALVIVSLCSNLGILVFFKYADFFTQDVLGLEGRVDRLNLILPAGISFHTFQSLSYTIDVYRKELPATRSVVEFATFVLFFPQLVAGPIVRAQDLLPQLAKPPPLELHKATVGLFRIVVGLFKKIALADTLALSIVDRVFEAPERYSSIEVLCGVCGYALQIYLDFSAYSDIAIGSAQVLGFSLPENFRSPYRSANLQEFWRRWHISLSTWLRDYLYITLGGSKGAPWRTYVNLIATMLIGGLWHGASWAFIAWGALHGFGLAVTRFFQRATTKGFQASSNVFVACAAWLVFGVAAQRLIMPMVELDFDWPTLNLSWQFDGGGTWEQLVMAWLFITPVWAVLTAWLSRDPSSLADPITEPAAGEGLPWRALFARRPEQPSARGRSAPPSDVAVEVLRLSMVACGLGALVALRFGESWTWIPVILVTWALGVAADLVEQGTVELLPRFLTALRRGVAIGLVFAYVCLAWIFFRASSFDNALAVLRQIGDGSFDHPNLGAIVTTALLAGFACHFFADGSFRWLRIRFVALPAWAQGGLLGGVALVLRELAHHEIVPFIYFQF
ncbi:MAG: algI [Deltaproteobacteria bacterium]|nr:algI [Deltaproteobacteria bacterium]